MVPGVKPVTIAFSVKGYGLLAVVPACASDIFTNPPMAVPVRAAPLAGADPVPYRICAAPPLPEVSFVMSPEIIIMIFPDELGVIDPAYPIITPVVLAVPDAAAGVD